MVSKYHLFIQMRIVQDYLIHNNLIHSLVQQLTATLVILETAKRITWEIQTFIMIKEWHRIMFLILHIFNTILHYSPQLHQNLTNWINKMSSKSLALDRTWQDNYLNKYTCQNQMIIHTLKEKAITRIKFNASLTK